MKYFSFCSAEVRRPSFATGLSVSGLCAILSGTFAVGFSSCFVLKSRFRRAYQLGAVLRLVIFHGEVFALFVELDAESDISVSSRYGYAMEYVI